MKNEDKCHKDTSSSACTNFTQLSDSENFISYFIQPDLGPKILIFLLRTGQIELHRDNRISLEGFLGHLFYWYKSPSEGTLYTFETVKMSFYLHSTE